MRKAARRLVCTSLSQTTISRPSLSGISVKMTVKLLYYTDNAQRFRHICRYRPKCQSQQKSNLCQCWTGNKSRGPKTTESQSQAAWKLRRAALDSLVDQVSQWDSVFYAQLTSETKDHELGTDPPPHEIHQMSFEVGDGCLHVK